MSLYEAFIGIYRDDGTKREFGEHAHEAVPCQPEDIGLVATPTTPEEIEAAETIKTYFCDTFAAPIKNEKGKGLCLHCGTVLTGDLIDAMFRMDGGGFQWGLAHGEGVCMCCKWPARAYHFIKDKDGETIVTLRGVVLQYLPKWIVPPDEEED